MLDLLFSPAGLTILGALIIAGFIRIALGDLKSRF